MDLPIISFLNGGFPISTDPFGGNLRCIANEPNFGKALTGTAPRDLIIEHKGMNPITSERFEELINHFDGVMHSDSPWVGSVQIGGDSEDRVCIKLGKVTRRIVPGSSQAILANFSEGIAPDVRSAVTGAIHRSLELLSTPAESEALIPDNDLPKHKLIRALRSRGWTIKHNYFPPSTTASLKQRTYRVVAHIPNQENVERIVMTFPGHADGEHSRFHEVRMQNLIRGIYSAAAKDEERQPLLSVQA